MPRIERANPCAGEVVRVARDDGEVVHDSRGRDERITLRSNIRQMKGRAAKGHSGVYWQNSLLKRRENLQVKPCT